MAGQLPSLAGLGALGDLDLQLVGVDQIVGCDTEASRSYLLDGATARIAVGVRGETARVFAAFSGVGFAAETIHGDGQCFVGLFRDRAKAHGTGTEALDDGADRFDFFKGNRWLLILELEQTTQRAELLALIVDQVRITAEVVAVSGAHSILQHSDYLWIHEMGFPFTTPGVFGTTLQTTVGVHLLSVGIAVAHQALCCDLIQPGATDATGGAWKIFADEILVQTDNFEDLGAAVTLQCADSHLGEDFEQALADRLDVVLGVLIDDVGFFVSMFVAVLAWQHPQKDHVLKGLKGEVGIDRCGTITKQQSKMMDVTRLASFYDERALTALADPDQVVMDTGKCQK